MKINWSSFKGLFSSPFSRLCFLNMQTSPLQQYVLAPPPPQTYPSVPAIAMQSGQHKSERGPSIVLTPRYVWDVHLRSLTPNISLCSDLHVKQLETNKKKKDYLASTFTEQLISEFRVRVHSRFLPVFKRFSRYSSSWALNQSVSD